MSDRAPGRHDDHVFDATADVTQNRPFRSRWAMRIVGLDEHGTKRVLCLDWDGVWQRGE
jgi:hypothetical protein